MRRNGSISSTRSGRSEGKFDWDGEFFKVKNCYGNPKPWHRERLPIINAAGSGEGRQFAVRNANFLFTPAIDLSRSKPEIQELKDQAKSVGRSVEVLTFSHVVCRPTEKEAKDYWQYFANANADWGAVDNLIALQFANAQSFPHDLLALIRDRMAAGHGGFPLVGTPEQVADGISQLHEAGFKGTTLSFVDYVKEFPYFRDHVMPILEARGLRSRQRSRHKLGSLRRGGGRRRRNLSLAACASRTALCAGFFRRQQLDAYPFEAVTAIATAPIQSMFCQSFIGSLRPITASLRSRFASAMHLGDRHPCRHSPALRAVSRSGRTTRMGVSGKIAEYAVGRRRAEGAPGQHQEIHAGADRRQF